MKDLSNYQPSNNLNCSDFEIPQYDGNLTLESNFTSFENCPPMKVSSALSMKGQDIPIELSFQENTHIPVIITQQRLPKQNYQLGPNKKNLTTIKRNNKMLEAANLPTIVTLNPRSLYNKQSNFCTMIEQTEADVCFVSETWDRSHSENAKLLADVLEIEGYRWVKNVVERKTKGGKPAMLINEKDYFITELCPNLITVPVTVEASWALLTLKNKSQRKIKHIALGSLYYSSKFTKKDEFLDHISESFHILCSKYGSNLKFILSGDFNRLNIKPILNLSPDLKQMVEVPTRRNPDAILDLIITNIAALYQSPYTLLPLENDDDIAGKPSDHLSVVMKPLSQNSLTNRPKYRTIKYRSFPDSGIREMGQWLQSKSWNELYRIDCPEKKAEMFEKTLMEKVNIIFPEKVMKVNCADKPWVDSELLRLDRKRKREYNKRKKSDRWLELNKMFTERAEQLKVAYYKNRVEDLKTSNISQWYSKIKRMSDVDQTKESYVEIQDMADMSNQEQVEEIADQFAQISNQYEPLRSDKIEIPETHNSQPQPLFEPIQIHEKIKRASL